MKEATRLAGLAVASKQYEKVQNRKNQILSLVGVGKEKLQKAIDGVKNLI
jgi:hypothetical protein